MNPAALQQLRAAMAAQNFVEAERIARASIAEAPDAQAYEVLANALRAQERLEEALAAADKAVRLDAGNHGAQHGRAFILARLGRFAEALEIYDRLIARGVAHASVWLNRSVALLGLTRDADAEAALVDGVRRWPQDQGLQNMLASLRWMRGGGDAFARDYEAAVRREPDSLWLRIGCADLLRRADLHARAEDVLREGLQRMPGSGPLQGALGVLLDEMDRTGEGLPLLQAAVADAPNVPSVRGNLINGLLRLGRGDEALREIMPLRAAQPLNGDWVCYEAMAYRQMGDARYHELCNYEFMVQAFDLDAPPGFGSIADFNAALRDSLNRLHVLETHPLDQSLRHGSQTTRSLLTIKDPTIEGYLRALEEPIRAYIATMQRPDHPWSGRKSDRFKLSGCWSVKLKANGYHVNHIHPEGWISSAYYVSLPAVAVSGDTQEGWIKFGEPRWPLPHCTVEKVVQPKEGRLVLFPSYMWHGTIPFSAGERLTAPFDVVPA
ncbi:MAG: putative 2OG-Fe(II) oxygenase [Alphaproteobacteria bacterium]|nr:putative 2OG-Fe(II) oxygenase [Alphaproteobacteria bacterium]